MANEAPQTLGARGQVYVTLTAATTYGDARHMHSEEARRELTKLLLAAKLQSDGSYRARSRTTRLDISARVIDESPLLVVVAVNVRSY
jgi:hypothetical protein